jgi:hypothetical protein
MSGSDAASGGAGGSGLAGLLSKFGGGAQDATASQFSADGSTPSQFTMPGGNIPQYQGTQMLPATLGGVQGLQDAQNWTQAVQQQGGMTNANWQQLAQGGAAGAGNLQIPQTPQMQRAPAGARAASGQAMNFTPTQIPLGSPAMNAQGTVNLASPVGATLGPTQSVQNLMRLLQMGNKGFNI